MYIIATPEEEARFLKETETVIRMSGQTSAMQKTIHYFDMVLKDLQDQSIEFEVYTGAYTLDRDQLTVSKIRALDKSVIRDFGGLHELIALTTIERFTRLAKVNGCEKLVIFAKDVVLVEMLFKQKFDLIKLVSPSPEVRASLNMWGVPFKL